MTLDHVVRLYYMTLNIVLNCLVKNMFIGCEIKIIIKYISIFYGGL